MEIQSAFNIGVQGFQKATEDANKAAEKIATNFAIEAEATNVSQKTSVVKSEQSSSSTETPNLSQAVVELKVAEFQAKGSAEVIKSADENLGTLLDVRV